MAPLPSQKPRAKPVKPYNQKPREKKVNDAAKTSAKRLDKANHKDNPVPRSPQDLETQRTDHGTWAIIWEFATADLTLPAVEKCLHDYLGAGYHDTDWRPALKAVMDAEGNTEQEQALDAIHKLSD